MGGLAFHALLPRLPLPETKTSGSMAQTGVWRQILIHFDSRFSSGWSRQTYIRKPKCLLENQQSGIISVKHTKCFPPENEKQVLENQVPITKLENQKPRHLR